MVVCIPESVGVTHCDVVVVVYVYCVWCCRCGCCNWFSVGGVASTRIVGCDDSIGSIGVVVVAVDGVVVVAMDVGGIDAVVVEIYGDVVGGG